MRELKNKVYNYTEMEQMVREATCNDASDPQVSLMREIAKGTFTVEFPSIMGILWKRMKDIKTPQHPYKCAAQIVALAALAGTLATLQIVRMSMHHCCNLQVSYSSRIPAARGQR